jgi:hypothetical protein
LALNNNYVIIALTVLLMSTVFVIVGIELVDLHVDIGNRASLIKLNTSAWVVFGASSVGPLVTLFSILCFSGLMGKKQAEIWGCKAFVIALVLFLMVGCVGQKSAEYRLARANYIACMNPDYQPGGKLGWASALVYEKSTCKERNQKPW